jgi:hypothetical protein
MRVPATASSGSVHRPAQGADQAAPALGLAREICRGLIEIATGDGGRTLPFSSQVMALINNTSAGVGAEML